MQTTAVLMREREGNSYIKIYFAIFTIKSNLLLLKHVMFLKKIILHRIRANLLFFKLLSYY